jgi:uncharacterized protein (TIGR02996 family)
MTVMSEERAFLAAVVANPADATARLVFADWLTEHDDPRGEWLRARTQLALLGATSEELIRLAARERELAPAALATWIATDAPVWSLLGGGLPHSPLPDRVAEGNVLSWQELAAYHVEFPASPGTYLRSLQQFVTRVARTETARLFLAGQSLAAFALTTKEQFPLVPEDARVELDLDPGSSRPRLAYHRPAHAPERTDECDDTVRPTPFARYLAWLWHDTRGRRSFGA